jgi:hypothetical protein
VPWYLKPPFLIPSEGVSQFLISCLSLHFLREEGRREILTPSGKTPTSRWPGQKQPVRSRQGHPGSDKGRLS